MISKRFGVLVGLVAFLFFFHLDLNAQRRTVKAHIPFTSRTREYEYVADATGEHIYDGEFRIYGSNSDWHLGYTDNYSLTTTYRKGKINGPFTVIYEDGSLRGTYRDGVPTGRFTFSTKWRGDHYAIRGSVDYNNGVPFGNISANIYTYVVDGTIDANRKFSGSCKMDEATYFFKNSILVSYTSSSRDSSQEYERIAKEVASGKCSEAALARKGYYLKETSPQTFAEFNNTMRRFICDVNNASEPLNIPIKTYRVVPLNCVTDDLMKWYLNSPDRFDIYYNPDIAFYCSVHSVHMNYQKDYVNTELVFNDEQTKKVFASFEKNAIPYTYYLNQLPYSARYYTISNRDGHQLDDDIRVKAIMIFSDTPSRKTYNEYLELCKELKELDGRVSEMEIKGIPIIRYDAHSKSKTNAKSNSYMMDDKICQITQDGSYVYIYGRTPLINRQSIIDYHLLTERLYSYEDELLDKIEAGEKKRRHDFESYIDTHILNYIRETYNKRYLFRVPENGNSMISQNVHEELIKKYSPIVECNLIGIQASSSDLYDYNKSFDQLTADIIIAVVNKNKKKKKLILGYRYGRVGFLREDGNN